MLRAGARTLGDGMVRDVGGFWMGNTCAPAWLIHVDVWQEPPQDCKVLASIKRNNFFKKSVCYSSRINLFISFLSVHKHCLRFSNKDWGIPGSPDRDLLPECQKVRKLKNCSEPLKNWKTVTIEDTIAS